MMTPNNSQVRVMLTPYVILLLEALAETQVSYPFGADTSTNALSVRSATLEAEWLSKQRVDPKMNKHGSQMRQ